MIFCIYYSNRILFGQAFGLDGPEKAINPKEKTGGRDSNLKNKLQHIYVNNRLHSCITVIFMKIMCYGDSNTYGYDPRSFIADRYEPDSRWTCILSERFGWSVINAGLNGRQVPGQALSVPPDVDLLAVMLGTNDLLQGQNAVQCAAKMQCFLRGLRVPKERILLIAPPLLRLGYWVPDTELIKESVRLAEAFRQLAEEEGVLFLDSGEWDIPVCYDGVHFTEDGHRVFAKKLGSFLESWKNRQNKE